MGLQMQQIKQIAIDAMADRSSHPWKEKGNKFHHGERVATLAVTLRELIFPDDNSHDEILTVAAWFHDIKNGVGDNSDHAKLGAVATRELLCGVCSEAELDEICSIIEVHPYRCSDRGQLSNLVQLHQDADHIDHFGTYDVYTQALYVVPNNMTVLDVLAYMQSLQNDVEDVRNELNFEISRLIFDERTEYFKKFTERFAVELNGGVWDRDRIIDEYMQMS